MKLLNRLGRRRHPVAWLLLALALALAALWHLEEARRGVEVRPLTADGTPATVYTPGPDAAPAPLVVVAHGFAGSRQLMQALSYHLARAGYTVVAYDSEGHGRSPLPMAGDVTAIDGTTRLLVEEVQRVVEAGLALPESDGRVALLGHSMASDVVVRAALAEPRVAAVVAISMFSEAMTVDAPQQLLMVSGEWEGRLRTVALEAARQVAADARENETVGAGPVRRRAAVAPEREHLGVLYSTTTLEETTRWLNGVFDRDGSPAVRPTGLWTLVLLVAIVLAFRPVAGWLPAPLPPPARASSRRFLFAVLTPALLVPLAAVFVYRPFLPVLVADYLALHLALYGLVQLAVLGRSPFAGSRASGRAVALLLLWGIGLFGLALDRYGASFLPSGDRWAVIAALAPGAVLFLVADAVATDAGHGPLWRRLLARLGLLVSLALAALIDRERLGFVLLVLPVVLLFFCVHGLMGRWVAQRAGPLGAGVGLGLALAWALGVSFPLFAGSF
ncbi:alpha/beta hydrolase [Pseudohaliea rubra]|uniref:Lysophospholipase n=1 Tax=Pseudohaliea rubra DSM 19751 TaxID=1265313 RepID=A0A095WWK9_9GAMM|nr:alpha/beta fold hydrolase [Pseudohaliea rubra]KGE03029.1 Lysophospholipase [Pseudohaliea rubra DSM 19751]